MVTKTSVTFIILPVDEKIRAPMNIDGSAINEKTNYKTQCTIVVP